MLGYEMIQEIAERSQELWRPSPGSVYPTLQLLDDEGLIAGTETECSKKLFELTDQGRAAAEKIKLQLCLPCWPVGSTNTSAAPKNGGCELSLGLSQPKEHDAGVRAPAEASRDYPQSVFSPEVCMHIYHVGGAANRPYPARTRQ
jgi:DNA-binding PadR family transcriptional regulator